MESEVEFNLNRRRVRSRVHAPGRPAPPSLGPDSLRSATGHRPKDPAALARVETIRALQDKPADKLLTGLQVRAIVEARQAGGSGGAYRRALHSDPSATSEVLNSPPQSCRSDPHTGTRWMPRSGGHTSVGGTQGD